MILPLSLNPGRGTTEEFSEAVLATSVARIRQEFEMKQFACGDVVPGCDARWTADGEDDILTLVAQHAAADHGLTEIPDELVDAVRANIVTVG